MANILDYLDWRGDISFETAAYNEVDELILCRLSYIPFEDILSADFKEKPMPLCLAVRKVIPLLGAGGDGRVLLLPGDEILLQKLQNCPRFEPILLAGYINQIDLQQEKQFSATTMLLPDRTVAVVYRGTDGTMVGWKEDFNLSFADTIPAQHDAVRYLEKVAARFRWRPLRVCGHSKGGNLAVYAAAFCSEKTKKRVLSVRNADGPGFNDRILKSDAYQRIVDRISTYLPQSSIFGMLLEHAEPYRVVHSTNTGLAQHDLFSWEVSRNSCVYQEDLSHQSYFVNAALKDWLAAMTPQQREQIVDSVFDILHDAGVETIEELLSGKKNKAIMKIVLHRDENTRKLIFGALHILRQSVKKSFPLIKDGPENSSKKMRIISRT